MTDTNDNPTGWNPGDPNTLSPDQQNVIKLLEMTLAEARKGTFHAMSIVGVTENGFGSQVAGSNVPATYMGMGLAMRELEDMIKPQRAPAPVDRRRPRIIVPGRG